MYTNLVVYLSEGEGLVRRHLQNICTKVSSEECQFCLGLGGFQVLPAKKKEKVSFCILFLNYP